MVVTTAGYTFSKRFVFRPLFIFTNLVSYNYGAALFSLLSNQPLKCCNVLGQCNSLLSHLGSDKARCARCGGDAARLHTHKKSLASPFIIWRIVVIKPSTATVRQGRCRGAPPLLNHDAFAFVESQKWMAVFLLDKSCCAFFLKKIKNKTQSKKPPSPSQINKNFLKMLLSWRGQGSSTAVILDLPHCMKD